MNRSGAGPLPRWGAGTPVLWLAGFMGTGKTSSGQALARRLQRPFFDTDMLVEEAAGLAVPAIFAKEGEAAFRARERDAVSNAARQRGAVVALGGGALVDGRNRAVIAAAGPVICLTARPETIVARLRQDELSSRPLLAGPDPARAIAGLLAQRAPVYATADFSVATDGRSPDEVAAAIVRWLEGQRWWS